MRIDSDRVVVTGGAGFIGSHLVDLLLARNNNVLVIDDLSTGSLNNLADHNGNPKFEFVEASIMAGDRMADLFEGTDYVFHMATQNVRLSLRQPTDVHDCNTTGTLNVLKAAAAKQVKKFLYCSSSEVNGTADIVPMPEAYDFRPETIYGASKLAGEYYTQVFHRSGWLDSVIARPHNNYGPREHYDGFKGEVIPRFILWALAGKPLMMYGDGTQTRDFTYVRETAAYLIELLENDQALGETYNVCKGEEISIRQIGELIVEIINSDSTLESISSRPHDVLRLYGDNSKLRMLLGRTPSVSIREGLVQTINWFRKNVPVTEEVLASMEPQNWGSLETEPWLDDALARRNG